MSGKSNLEQLDSDAKIGFGNIFAGGAVKLRSVGTPTNISNPSSDVLYNPPKNSMKPPSKPPSVNPPYYPPSNSNPPTLSPPTHPPSRPSSSRSTSPSLDYLEEKEEVVIKAVAEFDYEAAQEDELSFEEGAIFIVTNKEIYDGWAQGKINGKCGVFPNNFVRFFEEPAKPKMPPQSCQPKPPNRTIVALKSGRPSSAPPSSVPSNSTNYTFKQQIEEDIGRERKSSNVDNLDTSKISGDGMSTSELRQFALAHKDEFKRSKKFGEKTRTPPDPKSIPSVDDVKHRISVSHLKLNTSTDNIADSPKLSFSSAAVPPKPPSSPLPTRSVKPPPPFAPPNTAKPPATGPPATGPPATGSPKYTKPIRTGVVINKPPGLVKPIYPAPHVNKPISPHSQKMETPPNRAAPVAPEVFSDELYMDMDPEHENSASQPPPPAPLSSEEVSCEDFDQLKSKVEKLEIALSKMNKLVNMLQSELDDEINNRKQLETELSRLKKTVAVLL